MNNEIIGVGDKVNVGIIVPADDFFESMRVSGRYNVVCRHADGSIRWEDVIENLVTTGGRNDMLDKYLSGSAYTAAWYLGLITNTSYTGVNAADTMASHAGWLEAGGVNAPFYSQGTRPAAAWSAASAGSKSLSAALTFSIVTTGGTLKGCFLASSSTKDGTTGTLYSAGTFSGGDQAVSVGNTLSVSYTTTITG